MERKDRYLDMGGGRGGIEVVGERGHAAHKSQNGDGEGQQCVRSIPH